MRQTEQCLLSLLSNSLNTLVLCWRTAQKNTAALVVTGTLSCVSWGQQETEANLSRTSVVWECVPGQQINEADSDPASNRRFMFSCRWTNCSWANSPTHFRQIGTDAKPAMYVSKLFCTTGHIYGIRNRMSLNTWIWDPFCSSSITEYYWYAYTHI